MRFLFDVNHPAHVHTLRPVIAELARRGHEHRVAARDKDVTLRLLGAHGIAYEVLAPKGQGTWGRARELLVREARFLGLARRFRPHAILGSSLHAARAGRLVGARSLLLNEDDAAVIPLYRWLAYPGASAVFTPDALAHERHGRRHIAYPSYHELFYLHPNRFRPDPGVRAELGLEPAQPYAILRLSALDAHHDAGMAGVTDAFVRELVGACAGVRIFISSERPLRGDLDALRVPIRPERMHDALAFARFFLGDSQTMAIESAVLGTPAYQVSSFVGRLSVINELVRYGLVFGVRPGEEAGLLARITDALAPGASAFAARRQRLLADKIDPLPWFVSQAEALAREAATGEAARLTPPPAPLSHA
jgi:uncharacterized protein